MSSLTDWQSVEINGIEFELNSILVEKWKGKLYRLVIHRQHRGSFTLATSQLGQDKLADPYLYFVIRYILQLFLNDFEVLA